MQLPSRDDIIAVTSMYTCEYVPRTELGPVRSGDCAIRTSNVCVEAHQSVTEDNFKCIEQWDVFKVNTYKLQKNKNKNYVG